MSDTPKRVASSPSSMIFRGLIAAEEEAPDESLATVQRYDAAAREWAKEGYSMESHAAVDAAQAAVQADPFARALMDLRMLGNQIAFAEYEEREKEKQAVKAAL